MSSNILDDTDKTHKDRTNRRNGMDTLATNVVTSRRPTTWRRLVARWLQRYTTAMGSSLHRDRLLKTLQYTLWWYARLALPHAQAAGNLSAELCWARYLTRAVEWPTAWEAVWNDSWTPALGSHKLASWAQTLGRTLAWSMVAYYPAEHLAFGKWKVSPKANLQSQERLASMYSEW